MNTITQEAIMAQFTMGKMQDGLSSFKGNVVSPSG
jgi:hypothetical protein